MSLRQNRLPRLSLVLLAGVAALAACSKTGSAPTGYGVNVTIDGTQLSSAQRAAITAVSLTVVDDTQPTLAPFKYTLDVVKQVHDGKVTFQYVPAATVANTDTLELGVDALAGATLVASGASGKVVLKATAVAATIVLEGIGDGGVLPGDGGTADGGDGGVTGKKTNGIACVTGDECNSAFCTDGVCCNEKCNDVCVSCNESPSTKGTCTPYAVNTDPEMECLGESNQTTPPPDGGSTTSEAGASEGGASEAGASEAGASEAGADASASDAADNSDAVVINTPDGGFMTTPSTCAGTCGGARACKFPDAKTTCGKSFCNSRQDLGTFVCDSNGGCTPQLGSCPNYICSDTTASGASPTSACLTQCAAHSDCQTGKYCDNHQCVPKNADGIVCTTDDECSNGHCSSSVCCNDACNQPGLSCNPGGGAPAGKCVCPGVTCAAGVACQVFYQDADGDGYGNATGSLLAFTAKAGCTGSPPTGFVADNTDCDDGDANAHPGQTAFFATASAGKHTFDYNCDGNAAEKETPEYPGSSCKYCGAVGSCSTTTTTCAAANNSGSFQCPQEGDYRIPIGPIQPIETTAATTSKATTLPAITMTLPAPIETEGEISSRLVSPILRSCCGCATNDKTGFLSAIACGATGTTYTCSTCTAAGGGTSAGTPTAKVQRCH
ncbi:MAG TPA: dickkopf-related protein [Polyangia bacterium]|jgi:hypothetical protein|nr:dickkopf-related protein [Polyangia bacterium]